MADISAWNSTAASNNSVSPDGFPEQMLPSGVNDSAREVMAAIRRWYEAPEWRNLGHAPTRIDADTFTVSGDQTAYYTVDTPIRCTDSSTLYGIVASSSHVSGTTTVNVVLDSGSLSASLSAVAIGPRNTGDPIPASAIRGTLPRSQMSITQDHGTKSTNYSLDISTADLHLVTFSAAATLTISSSNTNDKAIVVVKNGGFAITLSGIDNDSPTLTNAASKQDFLAIVKSFGKISCVSSVLNRATA